MTACLPGDRVLPPGRQVPAGTEQPGGPLTILMVDDDPLIRSTVVALLRGWGHRVIEAANANEALVVLNGPEPIDLLFSDVVMPPGMPGTELAQHARRLRPELPVLLASGFAAHAVGADDEMASGVVMIAKPYAIDDLKQQLARVHAERTEPPPSAATGSAATGSAASYDPDAAPTTARVAAGDVPPASPARSNAPRVLIAEDLPINRELLAAIFRDCGYRLDLVGDGTAAVEAARGADYDLVLMDVHMPGMDGLTATRTIRAMPSPRGRVPILALSAASMPEELAEYRAAGMDGHIGKPYDRDRLLRETARILTAAPVGTG